MCGICGIYYTDQNRSVDPNLLRDMTQTLYHRGPDDEGYYCNNNIGLGHRRLSIIDLDSGRQPIYNETGSIAIVFNGEIYNYKELKAELIRKNHIFKTNTDTETIVHLYEELGEDCVNKLRGMFAFAIWDQKKQQIFLARDRLGIKPLYYYYKNGKFLFGSEIKAILQDQTIQRDIDFKAMDEYFTYLYVRAPRTIFQGIQKLLPGHTLICNHNGVKVKKYWDLQNFDSCKLSEKELEERLYELLEESVRIRLMSDVPLGAFLSGGVDSSAIVAIMSRIMDSKVITSSIGFKETRFDETSYARMVARHLQTDHHEHIVMPDAVNLISKLVWHFDEPFADSSAVPTYYVSKMTRENVKVALSGDGGDENFAGYRNYYIDMQENRFRIGPDFIRKYIFGTLSSLYPQADYLPQFLRGKTFLRNLSFSPVEAYHNTKSIFNREFKEKLFSNDLKHKINGYDPIEVFREYYHRPETNNHLSHLLYLDMKTYLVDDILTKVDRMSMANSLEVRVPLLDHKLVEFIATIPPNYKLKGKIGKYIFKETMAPYLPDDILKRKKWGFGVPVGTWLKNELREFAEGMLFSNKSMNRGFFNTECVRKIWTDHQNGARNHTHHLWSLLIFEIWHSKYIGRDNGK